MRSVHRCITLRQRYVIAFARSVRCPCIAPKSTAKFFSWISPIQAISALIAGCLVFSLDPIRESDSHLAAVMINDNGAAKVLRGAVSNVFNDFQMPSLDFRISFTA